MAKKRKKKLKDPNHTPGESKYAKKVKARRKLAQRVLGVRDAPLPVIKAALEGE